MNSRFNECRLDILAPFLESRTCRKWIWIQSSSLFTKIVWWRYLFVQHSVADPNPDGFESFWEVKSGSGAGPAAKSKAGPESGSASKCKFRSCGDIEAHPAAGIWSPVAADWQYFDAVLGIRIKKWIRIRRNRMFSSLPDPAPNSLVRGTEPEPSLFL